MAGTITHQWNGTVLTITSDSGTSSMDLKGAGGDIGPRGPQGPAGISIGADGSINLTGYATEQYVDDKVAGVVYEAEDGATFLPIVDSEGNLTWTNDKGLDNPVPVNIRGPEGPKGADGTMTFEDLTAEQKASLKGDKGDKGDQGEQGPKGDKGDAPVKGTDYWTAADQEQIVADVLAAIGDGDEVSY